MALTNTLNLDEHLTIAKKNPPKGTANQIITLSLDISKARKTLDASLFSLYKEKVDIEPKTFSKLKKIGDKFSQIDSKKIKDVINGLPSLPR